jgi:DNA-binding NtrC family response regulator
MNKADVFLVSADLRLRQHLSLLLARQGIAVREFHDRSSLARLGGVDLTPVILASVSAEESMRDVTFAGEMRRAWRERTLLLVAAESSENLAISGLRKGVSDIFRYPLELGTLEEALKRTIQTTVDVPLVGDSKPIQDVRSYLLKVAATDSNVLITGETGTGKELAAEMVHRASSRRDRPWIPVNCAAIPETLVESELFGHERGAFTGAHTARAGKFQLANGGTLFLDEIGDMDLGSQAKLLRVIESKEVQSLGAQSGLRLNVRVVAATNRDPEQLVKENRFRKDLFFRLNVARVHLAPLRERKEDIPPLLKHAIAGLNRRFGLQVERCSEEALALLLHYDWPGNVRELNNLLEAAFIGFNSPVITPADFPESFHRCLEALDQAPADERERLVSMLAATNWNKSKAAQALQWSRMTLYRKLAKYQISSTLEKPQTSVTLPHAV